MNSAKWSLPNDVLKASETENMSLVIIDIIDPNWKRESIVEVLCPLIIEAVCYEPIL